MEKRIPKHWISFRVKDEEYLKIYEHFEQSTCNKLSDYARKVLLEKPVVIKYRNKSADEFLSCLLELKRELNSIGNNLNQQTKRLHKMEHIIEIRPWLQLQKTDREILFEKMEQIYEALIKTNERWL